MVLEPWGSVHDPAPPKAERGWVGTLRAPSPWLLPMGLARTQRSFPEPTVEPRQSESWRTDEDITPTSL